MTEDSLSSPDAFPSAPDAPSPEPSLTIIAAESAHYVHDHLGLPIVREVLLHNHSEEPLGPGRLELTATPPFATVPPRPFDTLAPGATLLWETPSLRLDSASLAARRETEKAVLRVRLVLDATPEPAPADLPGVTAEHSLLLLPFNQWPGLGELPELLAAYVTPNQPCISEVLHLAAARLGETTGNTALDGYQSGDPRRVVCQLEAIFHAVCQRQLTYVSPPPGYESTGQKIRYAEEVWQSRQAACLDLTLFFASALEAAGLHPLLCLEKDHAYVACWLTEDRFFDLAFDDQAQTLRKGIDAKLLTAFETTLATGRGNASFSSAETAARERLDHDDDFRWALDLARARSKRVRPLPVVLEDGRLFVAPPPSEAERPAPAFDPESLTARFAVIDRETAEERRHEPPSARVARWQRQLLDLSLRNRLLNLQERTCVRLLPGDVAALEDHLAEAGEVQLLEKPERDARAPALHTERTGESLSAAQLTADLQNHKLRTDETKEQLLQKLTKLERDARVALDESGSNTLFLALGVLAWRESPAPSAPTRLAPLLLVPVHLTRRTVRSGFRLRRRDEETLVNVTLLEKLKREFGLEVPQVDPPPLDESGVDVPLFLQRFRQAVIDAPGFEVREEAFLGPFSFSKFLLWRDLNERLDELKRNDVVAHLIDHWGTPFHADEPFLAPADLDDALPLHECFNVLEADSTQLAAMANAGRGRHFVLNGPPGTGKSQTIANVIAQCMALEKSVLFVAEKKTALEVVQRRLDKIGLGPFCLELHSNKTGKTDFIRQLREAVDFGGATTPEAWSQTLEALEASRAELNDFVAALHRRSPNGLSPYACFGALIPHGGRTARPLPLAIPDPTAQSPAERETLRTLVAQIILRLAHFPDVTNHPLQPLGPVPFTLAWEAETAAQLTALRATLAPVATTWKAVDEALLLGLTPKNLAAFEAADRLCGLLQTLPEVDAATLRHLDPHALRIEVNDALARLDEAARALAALDGYVPERLLALDLPALEAQWDSHTPKFFATRWLGQRKILALLAPTRRNPGEKLSPEAVKPLFAHAQAYAEARTAAETATAAMQPLFGPLWRSGAPDPEVIEAALLWLEALHRALAVLVGSDFRAAASARARLAEVAAEGRTWLREGQPGARTLRAFESAWETFSSQRAALDRPGEIDLACDALPDLLPGLRDRLDGLLQHQADWQRWTLLQTSLKAAREAGLTPFLDAVLSGALLRSRAAEAFDLAYAWETLRRLLDREPMLLNFFGEEHQERIRRFRELDTRLVDLNRQIVIARLAAARPDGLHDERALGEIATLRGEIAKQRRLKPVRALLSEVPGAIRRLKPCVLMSPLSVAQYLDAGQMPFDVVIFDEASQIPVCDAIGALARGRQSIIAGDPRQLPPTSFFQKADLDIDESEEDAPGQPIPPDQESILDECLAAQVPEHHLAWHYRSRRESLIAFSNQHYYGNRLLTFPAPEAMERGVHFHSVSGGSYDRGGSRTNPLEAQAVVAAVREHLLNPETSTHSLAVITFNSEQMTLIENLLDAAREQDPAFDDVMRTHTAADLEEPFKVRNLESIQGDERDVIFFSITYGPDRTGYVSHNFGPINKAGGERRLNVAITRAKEAVHVFSTLRSSHIDLRRTAARGVLDLKNYLRFAESGAAIPATAAEIAAPAEEASAFPTFIANALRELGWTVHPEVGCSGYRIDLAVVHPDSPGRYLAGLECDGPTYHRAANARDRDRLRQSFLQSLGWHLLRVWSADWFRDPRAEILRLDRALHSLKNADPATRVHLRPEPTTDPEIAPPAPPIASASRPPAPPPYPRYIATDLPSMDYQRDRFHEPRTRDDLVGQIATILVTEAPLTEELLIKRLRTVWGFNQAGRRIIETIQQCLPADLARTRHDGRTFLWHPEQNPADYRAFRGSEPEDPDRRRLEEIAPQEIAAAMAYLVHRFGSAQEEELLRETAAIFGWKALTPTARDALAPGLHHLLTQPFAHDPQGLIRPL